MGNNGSRKMSGSKTAQMKLPIRPKKRRLGGRPETGLPKKFKSEDGIAFKPVTKTGTDPEMVFAHIAKPMYKKKEKAYSEYVSMSVKLPALKK